VEYSYSIDGTNPVFDGAFSLAHSLNWSVPIETLYLRVLWQKNKKLNYKITNSDLQFSQTKHRKGTDYSLEQNKVTGVKTEDNTPYWFNASAIVNFSDTKDWAQTVQWGSTLFNSAIKASPQTQAIVDKIKLQAHTKAQQISAILKFVQNEVRYLGIEFGENSHKPSDATQTLTRHYGDCKDKVVLLITLLKAIGVDAYPALVNTDLKYKLIEQIPRYSVFDHVIAKVDFAGQSYWFDPTRQNQSGTLKDIYQPDYGYALILDGKSQHLTKIEINQPPSPIIINEVFHLKAEPDMTASYQINTSYHRYEADIIRSRVASKGLAAIRDDYLEFYQGYYESLVLAQPLTFNDDPLTNIMTSTEHYSIESMWKKNDKKKRYNAQFYANLLSPSIDIPTGVNRTQPLAVDHPMDMRQHIEVFFETDDWRFTAKKQTIDNEFFSFHYSVDFDKTQKRLVLDYQFATKTDFVPADKYADYVAALQKVDENDSYGIRKSFEKANSDNNKAWGSSTLDGAYWTLIIAAVYLCLWIIAVALYRDEQ
ncbi:MAG: DUF3857 and transglutaminase domain-containing protein, partial [Psychrosphaera sp.]|nr:DUF3857 and transglutaminase domain-containing protein [Psychrosphaera sp.]